MEDDFLKKPHPYSICEKCQKIARDEYRLYIGDVLETKLNLLESIRYTKDYKARHSLASKIIKFLFNISRRMDNNYWLIYRRFDSEKYKCAECKTWYRCKFMKSIVVSQIFNFIVDYEYLKYMAKTDERSNLLRFNTAVRNKLMILRGVGAPFDQDWHGFDYYYMRLFNYSYFLKDKIPDKINYLLNELREEIYCHPLASHGLRYESWCNIEELLH